MTHTPPPPGFLPQPTPAPKKNRTNTIIIGSAAALIAAIIGTGIFVANARDDSTAPSAAPTPTPSAPPTATPPLSQAETKRLCSLAVAEAAPGWENWSYSPGEWQNDPRTPEVCLGLADEEWPPNGNREFMDALVDGLQMADDPRASQ